MLSCSGIRWDVQGTEAQFQTSFEGHVDWVNDVALVSNLLVSCSNDKTVKLWNPDSGGQTDTLSIHDAECTVGGNFVWVHHLGSNALVPIWAP